MFIENENERLQLKGNRKRITKASLESLRQTNPFELLNRTLIEVFNVQLYPHKFSPIFHNYVKVDLSKGTITNNRFTPHPNYTKRDIMVEGSGFLQWLSVYTFALNKNIDILLLDEPDAHLHCSLQTHLLEKLIAICNETSKQVLMASHSTEIIKFIDPNNIIEVKGSRAKYISAESQKVALLGGLGTEYSPMINKLQRVKRVLFVENSSDAELLKIWCERLKLVWPNNLVIWPFANNHDQRKQLFHHLKDEINDLVGISLEDRDNDLYENTQQSLIEKHPDWQAGDCILKYRRWRRWETENYLICPEAISRVAEATEQDVRTFIQQEFNITIGTNYNQSDRTDNNRVLFDIEGKKIIQKIEQQYRISKNDIAKEMATEEVFEDVRTLVNEIISICQ